MFLGFLQVICCYNSPNKPDKRLNLSPFCPYKTLEYRQGTTAKAVADKGPEIKNHNRSHQSCQLSHPHCDGGPLFKTRKNTLPHLSPPPKGDGSALHSPTSFPPSCGAGVLVTPCILSVLFVFGDTHPRGWVGGGVLVVVRHSFGRMSCTPRRMAFS